MPSYRKDLDALRAIAVLLVILFHAQISLFSGGFIGVDIFFVISGFLITGIVVTQIDQNQFSFRTFYERRLRRIYPALLLMVLIISHFCYITRAYADDTHGLRHSARSALLYYSNLYFYWTTDYFDTPAIYQVFLHTWSLSVEMQFYLLYPLLLYFACRYCRDKLGKLLLLSTFLFLAISIAMTFFSPKAAFYMLPSRAYELTLGGFLAVTGITPASQRNKKICIISGLVIILAATFTYNRFYFPSFPGLPALAPCLGASLFIVGFSGLSEENRLSRFLLNPALVFIGLISYSLYLWHWPFLVIYKRMTAQFDIPPLALSLIMALVFLVSIFSWKWIENPIRKGMNRISNKKQYLIFLISLIIAIASLGIIRQKDVFFPSQKKYANGAQDKKFLPSDSLLGDKAGSPSFLLLGDSHALMFAPLFDELSSKHHLTGRFLHSDGPLLNTFKRRSYGDFLTFQKNLRNYLSTEHYQNVYIFMRWSLGINGYLPSEAQTPEIESIGLEYKNTTTSLAGAQATYFGLKDTLDYLKKQGAKKIYLIMPIPENTSNIPVSASTLALFHDESVISEKLGVPLESYEKRNHEAIAILNRIKNEYDFVELIDIKSVFYADRNRSLTIENGHTLYFDDDHLSLSGTRKFTTLLDKTFTDIETRK